MAVYVRSSTWVNTLYWTSYATNETPKLMPLTHVLATKLGAKLTEVRKNGTCSWLRPDGKTQVNVEYRNDGGAMVHLHVQTVLISSQHDETVTKYQFLASSLPAD